MATKITGLGRGLDALIRETSTVETTDETPSMLPLKDILPNPNQPRKVFEKEALDELAASIKSQGILQPLLVRPLEGSQSGKYEIVAGERRWRASRLAGLTEAPVIIRDFTEQETLLAALIENLQREDLNPIEEALGIETLKKEFSLNQEELAARLGKSRSAIANSLRLLALPQVIQEDVASGTLSAGHARSLLAVDNEVAQLELRGKIIDTALSVRETEGLVSLWKSTGQFEVPSVGGLSDEQVLETRPTKRKKPSSERLLMAQKRLAEVFSLPVKLSGTENKGKVTISFADAEELDKLLALAEGFEKSKLL